MGLSDKLNALADKAKQTAAEHKEDLHKAAQQATSMANKQTKGKYRGPIQKAAAKVDALLDKLPDPDDGSKGGPPTDAA
jgi:hypothetical protein